MWFGKNIMTKLGLVLAMAVPALAAEEEDAFPLDPLYFPGATDDDAQEIWSELMKYKLWATSGFDVGNRLEVKEDKGWVGTSDGDFVMTGPGAQVGGPIIIGGNVDLQSKGAGFLTGPLRVEKTLTLNTESEFYGTVCIQGDTVVPTRGDWNAEFINGVYQNVHGEMIIGSTEATTGACANDKVAFVEKKMTVPSLKSVTYNGNLVATGNHQIDVPNEEGPYDLYYESVTISNDSKLHINMPKGGRLTRIFTKSITFGNQAELQVMYDGTLLSNQEYEGMFMIYVSGDIVFDNTNDKILQGTFISSGTITTKCNMKFAGQMIANKIVIGNEIKGDDAFRYVPVVPPVIDIKPTASAMGGFIENNTTVEIPITLSTATKNGVSFKYCFDLSKSTAELADFNVYPNEDKDGNEYPAFPVCGSCGSNCGTVDIPRNAKEPDKKVYLNVKLDDDGEEPTEKLAMKIYDLNGAVLPKNSNGLFDLNILNVPLFNFGDVDENYYINEHAIAPNDTVAKIPIEGQDFTDFVIEMVDKAGSDTHPVKLNDLFDIAINETEKFVAITVKKHDELDYESDRIKHEYQVTLNLKDKGGVEGCKTVTAQTTINIEDINEPPYFVNFGPYEVKEHSPKGTSVGFVLAEDPDDDPAYNTLVYTIPVNEDNDKTNDVPFAINPSTGEITVAEPNKEKFDYETHPLPYVFNVEVFDNLNRVPKEIEISLIDINEPPIVIDTTHDTISVAENSPVGVTKMAYFEVSDPDADDNANLLTQIKPTITDNKKKNGVVSAEDLFEMVMEKAKDEYGVDKYWAVLKVKADLDFEAIMAARGDSVFEVTLTFTDQAGAGLDTSLAKKIAVTDMNEEPYFTAAGPFDVKENSPVGTPIGEVKAADDDIKEEYNTLYYTIPVNEDSDPDNDVPFAIVNIKSGLITVANKEALDFEDPNILEHKFEFKVQVTDGEFVKDTLVTITLVDDDEPPIIIPICEGDECPTICQGDKCVECKDESCHEECVENCDKPNDPVDVLTVSVNENSRQNYEIMRYLVRDEDFDVGHSTALMAEIKNTTVNTGAEDLFGAKMEKDADGNWNVVVYVADSSKLDYETLDFYTHDVTINVRDPEDAEGVHGSLLRVIKVVDVNEAPTITGVEDLNGDYKDTKDDFTFYPKENLVAGGPVGYVHTYDPDVKHLDEFGYREFSLDNPDNYPFEMKDSLLVLTKKLDYEKDSKVYTFDVIVNNCERAKNSAGKYEKINPPKCTEPVKQTVTVKLQDVPEPPKIIPVCEGGNCVEICKGGKCEVCVGETCDEHEICTDNCDNPRGDDPAKTLTVAVKENSQTGHKIISYAVRDEDYGVGHTTALTAEIRNTNGSGADTLFEAKMVKDINGNWNVVVSVIDSAKLDYEKINETHNVTIYVYDPEDSDGMYDSLLRVIKVVDVNEAPKAEDADFKPEENLPDSAVVGELMVVEPDIEHIKEFGHLEYSIIGKDETFVFAMDSNRVIVNDPSKMDYELPVHFYTFDVLIANCELNKTSGKYDVACLYDTAKVTVDIQDVNEKPTIIVDGPISDGDDDSDSLCVAHCDTTDRGVSTDSILTIGIKENTKDSLLSKTDMVIFQYHVVDPDTGHAMGAKVEWIDFGSSISSSTVKGPDLFDISYDPTTQTIKATVKDEKLLDYEELRKATSRKDPDPEYKVGILVTDPNGLKDTLIRVIRIIDVNEKPLYTAEPCVVVEGNHPGDSIGHVEHPSDIDSLSRNPALYDNQFKMTGGDIDRFELRKDSTDLMRVILAALDSIDCENNTYTCGVDSVYWVELTYGDTTLKTVYNNIRIPVKVLDLNEPPEFRTDTIGVAENSPMGTVVDTIKWFDWDRFDTTMHFEISNDSSGCFAIDKNTGIVTVKKDKCAALDHEKNPTLKIEVAITDMVDVTDRSLISGGPNTVKKIITVNVHDVNEPPTIIKETFSVDEDAKKGTVVDTVKATDPDKDPKFSKLIFTAIGGDTATFKIDSITGIVTLKDTLDYETKNKYELVVRVYDGEYADTAIVPIYVNNKIEKTEVKITLYDDSTKVWHDPDTVFTNSPGREICWVQGRSDRDLKDTCMDVHITKDSVIVIRYKDPTTDSYGVDSVFIFYSNATPIVTISGDQKANLANNFYTIVEDTDKGDTNLYVNERKKDVHVTVKDPANKKDTSFVVKLNLQTVNVPQKTLDAVNKIVNENRFVLNENPKGGVTRTPVNGNEVKYSYREVFGKDTVTVSYKTDNDGNPVLVPVLNDKGKVDSIEVMTVSYNVVIDGKTVTISFVVNAATGEVLVKDSNGTLMESGASKVASSSSSKGNATSSSSSNKSSVTEGMFLITYSVKDPLGNSTTVSYSVDEKGKMVQNADGDTGYAVAYTYTNMYGNSATQSLFIVLDQKGPTVEILKPLKGQVIRSNYVEVVWTVNGEIQDTLTVQGLDKGPNYIKRFYRDKAGNEAADTVLVIMKDSKDVEIAIVTPVTEMNPDEVKEYYEENPPEEGETFAVSILNPTSGKEVETLKGGSFKTKKGSGEELYPGKEKKHLGPTLALDVKLPTIKDGEGNTGLGGLATLDDLVLPNGKISNIGIGIDTSKLSDELKREYKEYTVEEYVEKFCEDGTSVPSDLSKFNMYKTKMQVNIWVYTSLGNFVDYFSFGQEMNDPEYTNDAGKLKMFFEMKPDKDGFVKADNGKLYATGAYLYKVEATIRSTLRCTILDEAVLHDKPNAKRKGDKIKSDDELLKPFGYKRPKTK
ncbi:cadherin repeat domain-containing protein [Fibrobacter sp.]|uniref:cadherin repeat domain-containing protein n=1 Tax=Fibrobacter sp. TaxID=35828 RepID=UPI0026162D2C|nr:cadherin repeat domain-containing protein [Fibrobacter sp.]MDD5942973.1 cadherin repeat domain-containing protein [Fibrobacter sp.]